jgi:hypothetical protein
MLSCSVLSQDVTVNHSFPKPDRCVSLDDKAFRISEENIVLVCFNKHLRSTVF